MAKPLVLDNERLVTVQWVVDGVAIGDMVASPFLTHSVFNEFITTEMIAAVLGALISICARYLRWYRSGIRDNATIIVYLATTVSLLACMLGSMHDALHHKFEWSMPCIDVVIGGLVIAVRKIFSVLDREHRHALIDVEFIATFEPCGTNIDDEWE